MTSEEKLHYLISMVEQMRRKQKEYFQKRDYQTLNESKSLEKKVDTLIMEYKNKTFF